MIALPPFPSFHCFHFSLWLGFTNSIFNYCWAGKWEYMKLSLVCVCVFWDWPPGNRWPQPMRRLISGEDWFPLSLQLLIACSFSCRGGFPWNFPVHIGISAGVETVYISFRLAVEISWMKHPCCIHKTQSPSKLPGSSIHVWIRFLFVVLVWLGLVGLVLRQS